MADVCVIGTGTVGLVSAACFASLGKKVIAVDKDVGKIGRLRDGKLPIYEPDLEELVHKTINVGTLKLTTSVSEGVSSSEIIFICVGTPASDDGRADMSQVEAVSREVAESMTDYRVVVEKSTVPVQTSQWVERTMRLYNRERIDFDVASNPEFLREGSAVHDFFNPDRIVIGASSERAREKISSLYNGFNCPVIATDVNTAELIKHAANSFLALKVSFINLVSELCERTGADVTVVADAIGSDSRIGRKFLDAGIGYGGSCFPKDLAAFVRTADELQIDFNLLKEVEKINSRRIEICMDKLHKTLWVLRDKQITILGLSFKPDTDDIRGAPAIVLIERLLAEGTSLRLCDPKANAAVKELYPESQQIKYFLDPYEAAIGSHALTVVTEWNDFIKLDWGRIKDLMLTPIIVDGRNILDPDSMSAIGFEYHSFGRPHRLAEG